MSEVIDPLSTDLTQFDFTLPLLAKDKLLMKVEKSEIKPTKDGKARMIHLELSTVNPATGTKGEACSPGVRVFDNIMLSPTGKAEWRQVMRNLAMYVQGVRIEGSGITPQTADIWHKQAEGRLVIVEVGYEPESTNAEGKTFSAKNVVGGYIKQ